MNNSPDISILSDNVDKSQVNDDTNAYLENPFEHFFQAEMISSDIK